MPIKKMAGTRISARVVELIAAVGDALVILGAAFLAHLLRFGDASLPPGSLYAALLLALFSINIFHWRKLYTLETYSRRIEHLVELVGSYTLAALLVLAIGFGAKTSADFSRLWFGLWTILTIILLSGWFVLRSVFVRAVQRKGGLRDRLLIIGTPQAAHEFTDWLDTYAPRQTAVMAVVTTAKPAASDVNGHKIHIGLDTLAEVAEQLMPDKVVLLVDWSDEVIVNSCLEKLRNLALDVELVVPQEGARWAHRPIASVGGMPAINLMRAPLSDTARLAKRVEDYVLASSLLLLLSPLFLVFSVLIKASSPGPVFYRQKRAGFQAREFSIFKFRTMRVEHSEEFKQATKDDDRVTPIGRFLRRTSLDELPQLINVLRGEMSLVGPRPHEVSMNKEYAEQIGDYLVRHKIRPGITGWAQVNGARGETKTLEDMERRIAFDLEYVDRWSVWFDIRILVRTAVFFLFHRNAY